MTALKKLAFNFTECTVTQGDTEVALVKNYCYSRALKVTPIKGSAKEQAFSYQTFSSVGEITTSQTIVCDVKISMDVDDLPNEDSDCLGDDETDFAPYQFTVAGFAADGTLGMCPEKKPNALVVKGENKCCQYDNVASCDPHFTVDCPDDDGCRKFEQ